MYRLEDHSTPDCTNQGGLTGPNSRSWSLVCLAPRHVLATRRLLALVSTHTPLSFVLVKSDWFTSCLCARAGTDAESEEFPLPNHKREEWTNLIWQEQKRYYVWKENVTCAMLYNLIILKQFHDQTFIYSNKRKEASDTNCFLVRTTLRIPFCLNFS